MMVHCLKTEDYYDILATNERILEDSRRAQRLAVALPRNLRLQEEYLQKAANLGLVPPKFARSPSRPCRSGPPAASASSKPNAQRPLPPAGFGGGRPSRNRIARELIRAGASHTSNCAAAALAATQALYKGLVPPAPLSPLRQCCGPSSDTSSDSEKSHGSSTSSSFAFVPFHESSTGISRCGYDPYGASYDSSGSSCAGSSPSQSPWRHAEGAVADSGVGTSKDIPRRAAGARRHGSSDDRDRDIEAEKAKRGARVVAVARPSHGGLGGGAGGPVAPPLLMAPTPAFLRRWRAVRKRRTAKKQAVRFLLRSAGDGETGTHGETARHTRRDGSELGRSGPSAPSPGSERRGSGTSAVVSSGNPVAAPPGSGVFIVYPGSSFIFPAQPLPYSLEEALEAVRKQQEHQPQQQQHTQRQQPELQHWQQRWQQHHRAPPRDDTDGLTQIGGPGLEVGRDGVYPDASMPPGRIRWAVSAPGGSQQAPGQQLEERLRQQQVAGRVWIQSTPQLQHPRAPPREGWDFSPSPHCQQAPLSPPQQQQQPQQAWAAAGQRGSCYEPQQGVAFEERLGPTIPAGRAAAATTDPAGAAGAVLGPAATRQLSASERSDQCYQVPRNLQQLGDPYSQYSGDVFNVVPERRGPAAAPGGVLDRCGSPRLDTGPLGAGSSARAVLTAGYDKLTRPGSCGDFVQADRSTAAPPRAPATPQYLRPPASASPSGSPADSLDFPPASTPPNALAKKAPPPVDVSIPPVPMTHGSGALPSPSSPPPLPTAAQLEAAAAFPENPHGSSVDGRSSSFGDTSGGPSLSVWALQESGGVPSSRGGTPSVGSAAGGDGSAASLKSLLDHQSAITRDVQALMQRLADMKGKLEK